MKRKIYEHIALKLNAAENCKKTGNTEWLDRHEQSILELVENYLPSGSGIDSGTKIDLARSKENRLVFTFGYHHMDENGYYDGWTEHELIVTPSLSFGMDMRITGRNRNDIKEYLYQVYDYALRQEVES